jgi:hypothetical protein
MAGKFDGKAIEDGTITQKLFNSELNDELLGGGMLIFSASFQDYANSFVKSTETLTITGSGFDSDANLYVDGELCENITVTDGTTITFDLPNLEVRNFTTRPYFVTIQNPNGATAQIPWRVNRIPSYLSSKTTGYVTANSRIDKFPFASSTTATNIGNLSQSRVRVASSSSSTHGYSSGGTPPTRNTIDKFPFVSDANATDVGDLTQGRYGAVGQSSDTHGYCSGGSSPTQPRTPNGFANGIEKIPFASDSNSVLVSNLGGTSDASGHSSLTHGYHVGGTYASPTRAPNNTTSNVTGHTNTGYKFPFANDHESTIATSSYFQSSPQFAPTQYTIAATYWVKAEHVGFSSLNEGWIVGGEGKNTPGGPTSPHTVILNRIERFPFASDNPSVDLGTFYTIKNAAGVNSMTHGHVCGGINGPSFVTSITRFSFADGSSAGDLGNLSATPAVGSGFNV